MKILRISLFGCVRVSFDNFTSNLNLSPIIQALLAYLLLERQRIHSRDVLAGLFWGDNTQKRARGCLNTTIWRLRHSLEPEGIPVGTYLTITQQGEVGFNTNSQHWLDVEVFEDQMQRFLITPYEAIDSREADKIERTLTIYQGDLLEEFYDDWAIHERERMRNLYLNGLACLMCYYQSQGAFEKGLACGHKILDLDPLREEIHRDLMRLYVAYGQRAFGVRQYEICRELLEKELGIPPMLETQALYKQIVSDNDLPAINSEIMNMSGWQNALQQVRSAVQAVDQVDEQLHQILHSIERLIGV
jgi:DNA-binding SARP family transcriptional activator